MRDTVVAIHRGKDGILDYFISLTLEYIEEDDKWVGTCLESGTSTFAKTLSQVRKELSEAVSLQFNEVERLGFIKEYLTEHSIHMNPIHAARGGTEPGFAFVGGDSTEL